MLGVYFVIVVEFSRLSKIYRERKKSVCVCVADGSK